MFLICRTSSDNDYYQCAKLDLGQELARNLLTYRSLAKKAQTFDSQFYCVEFFSYDVVYGECFGTVGHFEPGQWLSVSQDPQLDDGWSKVAAPAMRVTKDGILWSASPKHSSGYFETEEIPWDDLEAVVRGEDPFPSAEDQEAAKE